MISELNLVLVPDEELSRIRDFKGMLEEVQRRREAEQAELSGMIQRMYMKGDFESADIA
jgi:hypothetical protein